MSVSLRTSCWDCAHENAKWPRGVLMMIASPPLPKPHDSIRLNRKWAGCMAPDGSDTVRPVVSTDMVHSSAGIKPSHDGGTATGTAWNRFSSRKTSIRACKRLCQKEREDQEHQYIGKFRVLYIQEQIGRGREKRKWVSPTQNEDHTELFMIANATRRSQAPTMMACSMAEASATRN